MKPILESIPVLLAAALLLVAGSQVVGAEEGATGFPREPLAESLFLPFPPGERNVQQLWESPDGDLFAILRSDDPEKPYRYARWRGGDEMDWEALERIPEPWYWIFHMIEARDPAAWTLEGRDRLHMLMSDGHWECARSDGTWEFRERVSGTRYREPHRTIPPGYQVSRSFFTDQRGRIYTAGRGAVLYRFDPETRRITALEARLPAILGRESFVMLDASVVLPDGQVLGGTFDGHLFLFHPDTDELVPLGKPFRAQRILGMVYHDGMVWGIGGENEGIHRWFWWDPRTGALHTGGPVLREFPPVSDLVRMSDGTILFSAGGRRGDVYRVDPEQVVP